MFHPDLPEGYQTFNPILRLRITIFLFYRQMATNASLLLQTRFKRWTHYPACSGASAVILLEVIPFHWLLYPIFHSSSCCFFIPLCCFQRPPLIYLPLILLIILHWSQTSELNASDNEVHVPLMLHPDFKKYNYTGKCMDYLVLLLPKLEYHQKCNFFV